MVLIVPKEVNDFNSHAHVERDVVTISSALKNGNFNSHAHVERDLAKPKTIKGVEISTHTLTWSVTSLRVAKC